MIHPATSHSSYSTNVGPMSFHPSKYTGASSEWKSLGNAQSTVNPKLRMASTLRCLALSELAENRSRRAIMLLTKACDLEARNWGRNSPELASMLDDLAEIHFTQGNFAEARPIFWRAHVIDCHNFGACDGRLVRRLIKMAWTSYGLGDYRDAYDLYCKVQAIRSKTKNSCPAFPARSPLGQAQAVSQLEYKFIEQMLAGLAEKAEALADRCQPAHQIRCATPIVDSFKSLISRVRRAKAASPFDCSPG